MKPLLSLALTLVLCLVLGLAPAGAQAPADGGGAVPGANALARAAALYAEGVALYRRAEYGPAGTRFAAALEAGGDALSPSARARTLRARANCAYRAGEPLEAVGWYTAALRIDPRNADLRADVELARSDAGMPPADRGDFVSWISGAVLDWRPGEARWLALTGALLLSVVLVLELVLGGRALRTAAWLTGLVALGLATPWLASLPPAPDAPHLVLRSSAVAVRSEPRTDLAAVAHLEPGAVVERLDALDDWVKVQGADDLRGWVPAGALFQLDR